MVAFFLCSFQIQIRKQIVERLFVQSSYCNAKDNSTIPANINDNEPYINNLCLHKKQNIFFIKQ